jgi:hypothetical protein
MKCLQPSTCRNSELHRSTIWPVILCYSFKTLALQVFPGYSPKQLTINVYSPYSQDMCKREQAESNNTQCAFLPLMTISTIAGRASMRTRPIIVTVQTWTAIIELVCRRSPCLHPILSNRSGRGSHANTYTREASVLGYFCTGMQRREEGLMACAHPLV